MHNKPDNPMIRFTPNDEEAREIQSEGVMAVIYDETIWDDLKKRSFESLPVFSRNAVVRQLAQWVRVNEEKAALKDETTTDQIEA